MEKIGRSIPVTRPYKLPFESNKWGGAYFDGVSGYIDVGNPTTLNFATNKITIASWIRQNTFSTLPVGWTPRIIAIKDGQYFLRTNDNPPQIVFSVWTTVGGSTDLVYGFTSASNNTLNNIVGVYDGSNMTIYLNDNPVTTTAKTGNLLTTANTYQIGMIGESQPFAGMCNEVTTIVDALSQPQIQDLMYGRILPTQFDCRLWHDYRLGHARDLSGNGNHGILNGNVRFV